MLVVSKGDDDLLKLPGHKGWHFPQEGRNGTYLGYDPEEDESIAQLEALRAKGCQYLLFPRTQFWWLDEYPKFKKHLDDRGYPRIRQNEHCIVYQLSKPQAGPQ